MLSLKFYITIIVHVRQRHLKMRRFEHRSVNPRIR